MTKEEIKALINAKIAGQGTNVDGGGALATVLNEIIDAIPEGGGGAEPLIVEGCHLDQEDGTTYIKAPASSESAAKTVFKEGRVVLFHIIFDEEISEDIDDYVIATRLVAQTVDTTYGNILFNL